MIRTNKDDQRKKFEVFVAVSLTAGGAIMASTEPIFCHASRQAAFLGRSTTILARFETFNLVAVPF